MASRRRSPSARLLDIVRSREQVDGLTRALLPSRSPVFGAVSLPLPDVDGAAELAFIRTASWLYVHYFEAGRVGVRFLVHRNPGRTGQGYGDEHLDVVHALRTWSQHNLEPVSEHDARVAETCSMWFELRSGTRLPRTETHWRALLDALLDEAQVFLNRLLSLLAEIERDDDRDIICQQWEIRLERDWPAHSYHSLITVIAADLGREALNPKAFYDRHGRTIRDGLRLVSEDCDLEAEARKLIERALLTETASLLPITGHDVMEFFATGPGPRVGRLLECARRLYDEQPCDKEALLRRMAEGCDKL